MQFFFAFWLWMSRFLFPCSMNIRHHVYFLWAVTGQCWYIFGLWTSDCFLTWTSMENFVPGKSARPAEAVSEVLEVCVQQEAVQVAVAEGLEKKKDGVQELIKLRCEWEWAKLFLMVLSLCLSGVLECSAVPLVMTASPVWHLPTAMLKHSSWHRWDSLISPSLMLTLRCVISAPRKWQESLIFLFTENEQISQRILKAPGIKVCSAVYLVGTVCTLLPCQNEWLLLMIISQFLYPLHTAWNTLVLDLFFSGMIGLDNSVVYLFI